jgi:hypothetical protein
MTLKYKIQVVSESTDYMTDEPENNWFILFEIDEFDDETIICESKYRNELQRIKNYLDKEQRSLTTGDLS